MNTHKHHYKALRFLASVLLTAIVVYPLPSQKAYATPLKDPSLIVNTEAFQMIDTGNGSDPIALRFGATTNFIQYTGDVFRFSAGINAPGTISGTILNANTLLTGATIQGFGLYNCNGTSNKVTYNATTKKFLCEADQTGGAGAPEVGTSSFSGAVLRMSDPRYVRKAGDTMTGALTINITGGNDATVGLRVLNTITGSMLHAEKSLTSSGILTVTGNASVKGTLSGANLTFMGVSSSYILGNLGIGKSGTINTKLEILGTISGSRLGLYNSMVTNTGALYVAQYAAATGAMIRTLTSTARPVLALDSKGNTGQASHLVFGYLGSFDTNLFRSAIATLRTNGSFIVRDTISGSMLHAEKSLTSSGILTVTGNASVKGTLSGANLTFMGVSSSYILGNLGIGKSGTINTKLEILGTISGSRLGLYNSMVTNTGALYVAQYAAATGAMIRTLTSTARPVLALDSKGNTGEASHLVFGYLGSFDTNLFRSAIATLRTNGSFIVRDTISGSTINAHVLLTGATIQGFGLYNCQGTSNKLTYNATTKKFLCEADQTGGAGAPEVGTSSFSGAVLRMSDPRYVRKAGDTMTGALTIDLSSGTSGTGLILRERAYLGSGATLSGTLLLKTITNNQPLAGPGYMKTYAAENAGRSLLHARTSTGAEYAYQPALFSTQVMQLSAGGGTTISGIGTTVTSDTTVSHSSSETFGYMANFATSTTNNDTAGTSSINTTFFRGSAAGANGFFFSARIGVVDTTSIRTFVGLGNQTIATMVGADAPTGHHIGFQYSTNRVDTNWQFEMRDGSTQNVVDTGVAFTANKVYDLSFYCVNQCNTVSWQIKNLTDNTITKGSTSTNLPGTTTSLRMVVGVSTLTTAVKNIRMQQAYCEANR